MSLLIRETAGTGPGATVVGAIDGVNRLYTVTFDYDDAFVHIYVNGLLITQDVENGWDLLGPRSVQLREPLQATPEPDTLEIEYRADVRTGGGALGGVPGAPVLCPVLPRAVAVGEAIPQPLPQIVEPVTSARDIEPPAVSSQGLRPIMLGQEDC